MANVKINWVAYDPDPNDVDTVEIFRSDTLTSESAFQDALNSSALTSTDALISIDNITGTSSYTDSTADSDATYYYCLAAKNAGGYTVGARDESSDTDPLTAVPTAGNTEGAVACVQT